jgi:DNA-binding MarR family transcriptional regulator
MFLPFSCHGLNAPIRRHHAFNLLYRENLSLCQDILYQANYLYADQMKKDRIDELQQDWGEQRPDLDSDALGVVLRIQALAKILGDMTAQRLDDFDLQWWQYDVLAALRRQGAPFIMAATELSEAVMLTSGAMTNRLDRLEADGFLRRLKDAEDRRKVLVELTQAGRELIDSAAKARFQSANEALGNLSTEQRDELSDLLRQTLLALEG